MTTEVLLMWMIHFILIIAEIHSTFNRGDNFPLDQDQRVAKEIKNLFKESNIKGANVIGYLSADLIGFYFIYQFVQIIWQHWEGYLISISLITPNEASRLECLCRKRKATGWNKMDEIKSAQILFRLTTWAEQNSRMKHLFYNFLELLNWLMK